MCFVNSFACMCHVLDVMKRRVFVTFVPFVSCFVPLLCVCAKLDYVLPFVMGMRA